ncbi:MAG: hypothetical protein FWH46_01810 [Methanimicrococcus sp.]|nr:hypothetical protein [Methanimicrococcus sp.]
MTKGKSDKPAIADGRKNGQSQWTRKTNKNDKDFNEEMAKLDKQAKKIYK